MSILQFSERYLGEGTLEDRRFVEAKIYEIQALLADLDKVTVIFEGKDLSAPQEKQRWLNRAVVDIDAIRNHILDVWGMRNSGDTPEDNKKILRVIKILFNNINTVLRTLKSYVDDFNAENHVKLLFNVKWTPLPK